MEKSKIVWSVGILALVIIVLVVAFWLFSALNKRTEAPLVNLDSSPVNTITFSQIQPLGMKIAFRLPPTLELEMEDGSAGGYIYNAGDAEVRAEPIIEFKGSLALPSGATLPNYIVGTLVSANAQVSSIGETEGGLKAYRFDNIGVSGMTGLAYAIDHGDGTFSFWVTGKYSELPILEEIVLTTVKVGDVTANQN